MPLTPFHLGPALAAKAAAPNRFSFVSFALTQAAMDSEVVLAIFIGRGAIHGLLLFHTFIGSIIIAALVVAICPPLIRRAMNRCKFSWLEREVSMFAAVSGALAGGLSHIFLDALINTDVEPFAPFSEINPFYSLVSRTELHIALIALGAIGCAALVGASMRRTS